MTRKKAGTCLCRSKEGRESNNIMFYGIESVMEYNIQVTGYYLLSEATI